MGKLAVNSEARPILPENWAELSPLLDELLDAPVELRQQLLAELCGDDSVRTESLERLLAECDREGPLLDAPALDRFDQLAEEPDAPMPTMLSDRYELGPMIGRGGMAKVYLARDLKHSRDVAVKVIRSALAQSPERNLFLREIATAARLRHPNIVPLYDSGEDCGLLYFVMPRELGQSLRERLGEGTMSINEIVRVLGDVARALAHAHEQGVVHRDVKPDNVMLSGGSAVVTDFGISVALRAAQSADGSVPGEAARGTPAYTAPEQALGDRDTDQRADIYSFGCMAYELVTGKVPFDARSREEFVAAHRFAAPGPIGELRENVPPSLTSLIMRCLQKQPAARPQTAEALVAALEEVPMRTSRSHVSIAWYLAIAAMSVAVLSLVAVQYVLNRTSVRSDVARGRVAVAVLPLRHSGGDPTQASLAEGFTDEIATALVEVPWLRVMSRGGAGGFINQREYDYKQIGRELGVNFLLAGSMRERNGHEIVTVQLISAADGSARWAASFDRPSDQLETERDEIARSAAESLRPLAAKALTARPVSGAEKHRPNPQAYFLQVQAQQWLDRRVQSVDQSADYFRRAIAVDPRYAKAYSGLGMSLALYPYFQNTPAAEVRDEILRSARNAIRLDPSLSQPHIALGLAYQHGLRWDSAGAECAAAVRLDGHDVEARVQYGRYLVFRGRTNDAQRQLQAAREDDPASAIVLGWVSYAYYLLRELDSARVISDEALRSSSRNLSTVSLAAWTRFGEGDRVQSRKLALLAPPQFPSTAYILAATGQRTETVQRLDEEARRKPASSMANTSRGFAMMGLRDPAAAIDALERATTAGEIWPSIQPVTDPMFDELRSDARFGSLLERVGLSQLLAQQGPHPTRRQ
jgi:TolB-like protein/Tfp pilus assembly protein PilF